MTLTPTLAEVSNTVRRSLDVVACGDRCGPARRRDERAARSLGGATRSSLRSPPRMRIARPSCCARPSLTLCRDIPGRACQRPRRAGHRLSWGRRNRESYFFPDHREKRPARQARGRAGRAPEGAARQAIRRFSRRPASLFQCDRRGDHCLISEFGLGGASQNPLARTNCATIGGIVHDQRLSEAVERRITGLGSGPIDPARPAHLIHRRLQISKLQTDRYRPSRRSQLCFGGPS
jgi:hypothetical protein